MPSSSAPLAATTLNVEPGSNWSVKFQFLALPGGRCGTFTDASTSPVRGSRNSAKPRAARSVSTARARWFSAIDWMSSSSVSTTSRPSSGRRRCPPGSACESPRPSRNSVDQPGRPRNSSSSSSSSPSTPMSSRFVRPMISHAASPSWSARRVSGLTYTPWRFHAAIASPRFGSARRVTHRNRGRRANSRSSRRGSRPSTRARSRAVPRGSAISRGAADTE